MTKAQEQNSLSLSDHINRYSLDGGGSVVVIKPFGDAQYAAIVTMTGGHYPSLGKIARNQGRDEFLYVQTGSFEIEVRGQSRVFAVGESIQIPDGSRYKIKKGEGSVLVLVNDKPGGATVIEDEVLSMPPPAA